MQHTLKIKLNVYHNPRSKYYARISNFNRNLLCQFRIISQLNVVSIQIPFAVNTSDLSRNAIPIQGILLSWLLDVFWHFQE